MRTALLLPLEWLQSGPIFFITFFSLLGPSWGYLAGSHLLFLDPAFVVLLDPHAACLLAIGLILCVPYPGKGGGGEDGRNGQGNQRQQKSLHGVLHTECSDRTITGYLLDSSLHYDLLATR